MEELLKQLTEQMKQGFDRLDHRLQTLEEGQRSLENGQKAMEGRLQTLEEGQRSLEDGQKAMEGRLQSLEVGQQAIEGRLQSLEVGQQEIKESLKHNMTLMTENFTIIRKEFRTKHNDVEADVDLLFKEVESVKRHSHKIEQRLGN